MFCVCLTECAMYSAYGWCAHKKKQPQKNELDQDEFDTLQARIRSVSYDFVHENLDAGATPSPSVCVV